MDFALLSTCDERRADHQSTDSKKEASSPAAASPSGHPIALELGEASSRAVQTENSTEMYTATQPGTSGCEEHDRLLDHFGTVVHDLLKLHEDQFLAIAEGDTESHRFDLLIHMGNEKKQLVKYDYLRHVATHGYTNTNALNES
jgi:hypothetical protein